MKTRTWFATILILACAMPASASSRQAETKEQEIVMSHGQVIQGQIRAYKDGRYIVQGREESGAWIFYDVHGHQITTVDGGTDLPDFDDRPVIDTEMFERVNVDGSVESWNRVEGVNRGHKLLTAMSWGVADWEVERMEKMRVLDAFGNELEHTMMMKRGRRMVSVKLAVPVAPQESYILMVSYRDEGRAVRDGDDWLFRFGGDFPEDRLLKRKVILPAGAEVLDISPAFFRTYDHEGAPLVFWKRFFRAHEVLPMSIRYRLP
jgi:hypothetical protein